MMATERQEKGEKDDEEGVQKTELYKMNKNSTHRATDHVSNKK